MTRGKQLGHTACLLILLCCAGGCGPDDGGDGGIRLVGLQDAPCTSASTALFGTVPVVVEPTGQSALKSISVSVNDGTPQTTDEKPFQVQLDTTKLKDGTARIAATGTDEAGDEHSASVQVCIDNTGPTLTVTSPSDGAAIGLEDAALTVRVRASDAAGIDGVVAHVAVGGVSKQVSCKPPGAKEQTCLVKPGELGLVLAPKSKSELTLTVTARDKWGREARETRKLTVSTRLLWSYYTGGEIEWAAVPLKSGNIVVGNKAGHVHVVSSLGGKVCSWTTPVAGSLAEGIAAPMTANGAGTVVFIASTQRLYGFNPVSCTASWTASKGLYYNSQPAHDSSGVVYIGSYGELTTKGSLQAFNASDGKTAGSYGITAAVNEAVTGSPALSSDKTTVYIGSSDFKLYAINVTSLSSMKPRWTYATGGKVETRPLVTSNRIYLAGIDKAIHAIDPVTGKKDTGFNFSAQAGFLSAPVLGSNGLLYAGSLDLNLYAVDSTGKVKAKYETGRMQRASPAIGPAGIVYAVRYSPGRLYALSPTDLKLLWSISPGTSSSDKLRATPAVSGNTIYVGSTNGYLYALDATPPSS